MRDLLRVGIAGYGVVGQRRRQYIDNHPKLNTVALSDIKFTRDYVDEGVKIFRNYHDLFNEGLDILFVSLPNYLAPEVTINGLNNGCHVFCEKPPGKNVKDIVQVREIEAKFPNLKLKYGFNHRYHDNVRYALKCIQEGTLGGVINLRGVYGKSQIISFESDWRTKRVQAGGGILLDQGIHMLDLMRMFCGEFHDIHSFVSNAHWRHDVEDNAYALMRTKSGVIASVHSSATQWRHKFNLEISLEKGLIVLGGILTGSKSYGDETVTVFKKGNVGNDLETTIKFSEDVSWAAEISEFADEIFEDAPVGTGNSRDALMTMELVEKIYRADSQWANKYLSVDCDNTV